jgi:DNA topoisomerase IB
MATFRRPVWTRGRKQYRYHPKWRELRDQNKYEHIMQFAAALPALRARLGDTEAPVDPFMAVSKSLLDVPTDIAPTHASPPFQATGPSIRHP